jgi:hypothetical protein
MDRRDLLKLIGLGTGAAFVGSSGILTGCDRPDGTPSLFSASDIALMDEIADTIIPRTSTPGAKDAGVGAFMARMVDNTYYPSEQDAFRRGLHELRDRHGFLRLNAEDRTALLTRLDAEARRFIRVSGQPPHPFTMIKQLTLHGYFTSEVGSKEALRYIATPGRYEGDVPYAKGDRAWAL